MSCRLCHFPRGEVKVKQYGRNYIYWSSLPSTFRPPLFPIGSLNEFWISIGPWFQLQYDFLA